MCMLGPLPINQNDCSYYLVCCRLFYDTILCYLHLGRRLPPQYWPILMAAHFPLRRSAESCSRRERRLYGDHLLHRGPGRSLSQPHSTGLPWPPPALWPSICICQLGRSSQAPSPANLAPSAGNLFSRTLHHQYNPELSCTADRLCCKSPNTDSDQ